MKSLLLLLVTFAISYFFYEENKKKLYSESSNLPQATEPNEEDTFKNRANLHSLFHSSIFDLLNNMIEYKTQSEEVKESYLAVVKANMGLLNIGRGYEHNFFNGTLSKNIATTFLDDLVNLYTKIILEEDHRFTSEDIEIFKYMVDNHTIMMKDYKRIQGNDGFKKYKISYTKELRKYEDFNYNLVRVEGLEVLEDLEKNQNKQKNEEDEKLNKEIRDINIK